MTENVTYNQLISLRGTSVKSQVLRGSYVSEGKLVIVFGNNKKFDIDGKDIEVTGQKKRVREIVSLAKEKGFDITNKSIMHYAKGRGGIEYVLVRMK